MNSLKVKMLVPIAVMLAVGIVALLAAPSPAQAQTTCPADAEWCATMTVGYSPTVSPELTSEQFGYDRDDSLGALDDDGFSHAGTDYTVDYLYQTRITISGVLSDDIIFLSTNPSPPDGTVFTVNGTAFTVGPDSDNEDGEEAWDLDDVGITLGLVEGQMVAVSLDLPQPPPKPGSLQGRPQIVFAANAGASEPTARCLSAPYELRRYANLPGGIAATWSLDVVEPSGGFRNGASFTASDFEISNGQVKTIAGVNYPHQESSADVQPFEMVITGVAPGGQKSRTVRVYVLESGRTDHAWHNVCGQTPGEPPKRPRMKVADAEVHEAPGARLNFVVTLNRPAPVTMTADYWTYPGTATDGADYLYRYGTLTFGVGESEKTVSVPVIDDSVEDDGETVYLALHNPTGGVAIADDEAVGIIRNSESPPTTTDTVTDDDGGASLPALSVADASVEEGPNAKLGFVITLDRASSETVTVEASTSDGTATAGSDYRAKTLTKTFAPGETSKIAVVTVLDDSRVEGSETMTLTLSNASGAGLADGVATGTITDASSN